MSTALTAVVAGPERLGTVLASSRFACYIILHDSAFPAVIGVVAPGAVRLPIAMCVPHLPALTAETPAYVGNGVISAGGHTWRPVRWWDPTPQLDPEALRDQGWRLSEIIAAEDPGGYGIEVDRARAAVAALAEGEADPACCLLGYGPGLTPAGDDVIAGALAALALMELLPEAAVEILAAAPSRTTALSATLLTCAARGQVVPEAARLLSALALGHEPETITTLTRRLFAVGATSGHDLALGLATALTSTARASTARASTARANALEAI